MGHTNPSVFSTRSMTRMAVCVALLCVSAYISFQVPFASAYFSALTLAMNLTAFILTPRQTFVVILVYIALGAAGLPVLGGGEAGLGVLIGPRGGFYLSFLLAYPLVSACKGERVSLKRYVGAAIALSIPITYIGGVIAVIYFTHITMEQAFLVAVLPFIAVDVAKAVVSAWLGVRLNRIFVQQ